jgi:ketosteroid isomerase-like protein
VVGSKAQVVEQAYEAFGRGDIPAVIGALDGGVVWSSPGTLPHGGTFKGPEEVGRFYTGLGAAWDGLGLDVEAVDEVGGDLVVGIVRARGTRTATGSAVDYGAVHVFTVAAGRITRFREYTDLDAPLG